MADPTFADVIRAIVKIREETPDLAWMLDYPSVAKLLIRRAARQIDDQKFTYELYKTKFWKETSDAQRQWRTLTSILDPAKARRQRMEMTARVRQLMGEMGINLPDKARIRARGGGPHGYETTGATAAARVADLALYNGWSEQQLTNYLLSLATFRDEGGSPTGGIAVAITQIRRLEEQFGVGGGDRNRFREAKRLLAGTETTEGYEERLRRKALAKYGSNEELRGVLDRGGTIEDWFDPYRQMIAEELEVPPAEISVNSPRWQRLLMSQGSDGRVRPMTFDEARRHIRTRAEWHGTTKAKEMEAGMAQNLLAVFGKRAA